MDALHAICWLKSSFHKFSMFYHHIQKKEEKRQKIMKKYEQTGVYQRLGAARKSWLKPKGWSAPGENVEKLPTEGLCHEEKI